MPKIKLTREAYIPAKSRKFAHKNSSAVAYVYERDGYTCAAVFAGKRSKPSWHLRFRNQAAASKRISDFFSATAEKERIERKRKAAEAAAGRDLEVGDVLVSSWGYDQTNIDYYQVTRLVGKASVELREIARESEGTDYMQGKCVPVRNVFVGDPFTKRAKRGYVSLNSYSGAHKMDPVSIVGGNPVYKASHWTAYA